jgi:hypothetical protein
LNTIEEFHVSRLANIKRVQYKDLTLLQMYYRYNPMMATQTHRQIIVLLVHQVIMIIYKKEGRSYIKNKLTYMKLYGAMIQALTWHCNVVQPK